MRVRLALVPDISIVPNEGSDPLEGVLVARRRGAHELPAVSVRLDGPLGLGRWTHSIGEARKITAYPDMPAARRLALAVREDRLHDERRRGPLGLGTDFESIREYVPDDDVRRINWAATARLGRPMTNQYRIEQDRDVICLIDCGRLMRAPLGDRTRIDAAVDAVAAVGLVADELGDHAGTLAFDSEIRRRLRPRRNNGRAIVRAIYDLEASSIESDYELAFRSVGSSKRSLVMLFTDIFEEAAARPLIDAMPVLVKHHHVIVASVTDTDLMSILNEEPQEASDVYLSVVASSVLGVRQRVAAALRRAGADVIEASPQELAGTCVRRYLRAKTRVRL